MTNPALEIPVTLYQSVITLMFSGTGIMTHAYAELLARKILPMTLREVALTATSNQKPVHATFDNEIFAVHLNRHQPDMSNKHDALSPHVFLLLTVVRESAAS